jgi:hypothetical protein
MATWDAAAIETETDKDNDVLFGKIDGKPLPAERGPLRLVVLTDKEPSRSAYGLRKLEVLDVRTPAAR